MSTISENTIPLSPPKGFDHLSDWVFDLDNTLYPRHCNLFAQIDINITNYVKDLTGLDLDAARALQKIYYRDYGTTLNGLMQAHGIDPDDYLRVVHGIDYSSVDPHPELVEIIAALPGRKFIFTNADAGHAEAVLKRLGASHLFEAIFDIRSASYQPKPLEIAYRTFLDDHEIDPSRAIMFDDLEKNLLVPHKTGMTTVQVVPGEDFAHEQVDAWELGRGEALTHVHHITEDLHAFLKSVVER